MSARQTVNEVGSLSQILVIVATCPRWPGVAWYPPPRAMGVRGHPRVIVIPGWGPQAPDDQCDELRGRSDPGDGCCAWCCGSSVMVQPLDKLKVASTASGHAIALLPSRLCLAARAPLAPGPPRASRNQSVAYLIFGDRRRRTARICQPVTRAGFDSLDPRRDRKTVDCDYAPSGNPGSCVKRASMYIVHPHRRIWPSIPNLYLPLTRHPTTTEHHRSV